MSYRDQSANQPKKANLNRSPLLDWRGELVTIQVRGTTYAGVLAGVWGGFVALDNAVIRGTKNTWSPRGGRLMVSERQITHAHLYSEANAGQEGGAA